MPQGKTTADRLYGCIGATISLTVAGGLEPAVSLRIESVRHEPETGMVLVDAESPWGPFIGLALSPDTLVDVAIDNLETNR